MTENRNISPSLPKLLVHGGAGTISRRAMTPELEAMYASALAGALRAGYQVLQSGGASIDAVETAVRTLEDAPLFNAGRGAVFTHEGKNELDASIMDGRTRAAGSVAAITVVRNPVSAARAVMERTPHVMLCGPGADQFATESRLDLVDPSYFRTEARWMQLQKELEIEKSQPEGRWNTSLSESSRGTIGTVGAVAADRQGNLAAATSTGGMTNKRFGRIGDTPIIGAGTWADNLSCAVSATGHGELFIRYVVAHEIASLVTHLQMPVAEAALKVVEQLRLAGGEGGVIAIDPLGDHVMAFNSEGMYRGWIGTEGICRVGIFESERALAS